MLNIALVLFGLAVAGVVIGVFIDLVIGGDGLWLIGSGITCFIVAIVLMLIAYCGEIKKIDEFVKENPVETATVIGYDTEHHRRRVGTIYTSSTDYIVILNCECDGVKYIGRYDIPYSDYKKCEAGKDVSIKDEWYLESYELLD